MINRMLRGGSYVSGNRVLRTTDRYRFVPEDRLRVIGFRLVIRRQP